VTGRIGSVPTSSAAVRALTRAFLRRFFDNEITGGTQDLTLSFFWLMGFLAAPMALLPVTRLSLYRMIFLSDGPHALRVQSRPDKALVIALGMTAAAVIASVVWNSLMLERRDGLILGALPVRGRTVVLAKLAALATYIFGISVAMHLMSAFFFGVVLADSARNVWGILLVPLAHFTAAVASCAFVFLCVTAAQGLALALAGPAGFRRIASILQAALVAGIVAGLAKIPALVRAVSNFSQMDQSSPPRWLQLAPPFWFLGLYEWMLGDAEPVYGSLAATALVAFAMVAIVTLVTYALVYRRVMVRAVEVADGDGGSSSLSAIFDWIVRRISRVQIRRASAQFFFTSIGRVERLRLVVAVMTGVVCAWIVPALTAVVVDSSRVSPGATFALSYAAMLLIVIGLRITISMPADLRAAWMARMIDPPPRLLRSGLWRALFLTSVVPVTLAFAVLHASLWGARVALVHAGVMIAVGVLVVEAALWHFDDMSNQRPWRPEHANLRLWWPVYVAGFGTITGTIPALEFLSRNSLVASATIAGLCLGAAAAVRIAHGRPYPAPSFEIEMFVEPPSVLKLQ
jgi:hypothetical protein